MPDPEQPLWVIPPHGGYRDLKSYQMAEIVHDATVRFCDRFIDRRSRTHDQMVQAARSGKQNIAEGSTASGTSKKTELKLIGVARASLEELLIDYHDFLRQRGLQVWGKDDPENQESEIAANAAICLIHQTNYLLDQQLRALEQEFLRVGGFTERLYRIRSQVRDGRRRS